MSSRILVTDSLFVFDEHIRRLETAGFEVERLNNPEATEDQVVEAIKGKVGYIIGGLEKVTEKIIDAADELKVMAFTGIGYTGAIPAWRYATEKGIAITNTPDAPTHAVAEWAVSAALVMNRSFFELGRTGDKTFMTSRGIEGMNIGLIGLGRINSHIVELLRPFRPGAIRYHSRSRHDDTDLDFAELNDLLAQSDIVFLGVPVDAGIGFVGEREFAAMKDGALFVTYSDYRLVDEAALLKQLQAGRIRAISDHPAHDANFEKLSLATWQAFKGSNAFNTSKELQLCSDTVTNSVISFLKTGEDQYVVNPKFRQTP